MQTYNAQYHRERAAYWAAQAEENAALAEKWPHMIHEFAPRANLMREMADTHIESAERAEEATSTVDRAMTMTQAVYGVTGEAL